MNQVERIIESAKHIRRIKRVEAQFSRIIFRITINRVKDLIEILRTSGLQRAKNQLDHIFVDSELIQVFQDLHTTVGIYSANLTARQISKSIVEGKAGFGFDEALYQAIINFFRLHILNKAVLPYTQQQKDDIREVLEQGEREGWGVDQITSALIDKVKLDRYIIERIVRTEAQFAMQYGRREAQVQSRWQLESEWIAAHDHRTRHSHRDVDGDKVDEGKRFRVPIYKGNAIVGFDFMLGPGDITASPGNVINCRCTMVTRAKRDASGRLILKKDNNSGISVILPSEVFNPHTIITI